MKLYQANLTRGLFALGVLGASCAALAGSIQVSPVRVDLSSAAKVAVLTVRNTGADESVMQVTLNKWTLDGAAYAYRSSQELVVTPATFRLAPGKQQIVRIGMSGTAPAENEGAYRLLVEEVPPPPSPAYTQTRLVVRHDLPVFVAPAKPAHAALDVALECSKAGGAAQLRVASVGNVHALLRNVVLETAQDKRVLGRWDAFDYLLPGSQKRWELAKVAPGAVGKGFVLTAETDQGAFSANVASACL